ncbi:hypothetical protein D3H64_04385 [Atopobacter sp. AH10]|uniref:hypothetical protein n=1 Tax=Atopobacter sp. AH10 TaxID=2315861 RepID=UPI000EF1A286|nr:hypothetical protein [Atopobacter sp. AH10]RLK63475.1 hypothetical protein D3H64_04385 [Atopobacter sp. AH10]
MEKRKKDNFFSLFERGMLVFMAVCTAFAFCRPAKTLVVKKPFGSNMTYTGIIKQDKFTDQGFLTVEKKGRYEGKFKDGRFYGKGEFRFDDGSVYKGTFNGNKMAKNVSYTAPKGTVWLKGKGYWVRKAVKDEN